MDEFYTDALTRLAKAARVDFEEMECHVINRAYDKAFSRINADGYGMKGLSIMLIPFFEKINKKNPLEYQMDTSKEKITAEAKIEVLLRDPNYRGATNLIVDLMADKVRNAFVKQQQLIMINGMNQGLKGITNA